MYLGHETLVDFRTPKMTRGNVGAFELLGQVVPHRCDNGCRWRISRKRSKGLAKRC